MDKIELAWIMEEIGQLLELKGENPYRIRAYRRAARALKRFSGDIRELWQEGKLETLPGIGRDLAKKLGELLETGKLAYLEELRAQVPPGLLGLLVLPEIGPKTVRTCYRELGITSLEELEVAARQKRIRELPGLGAKTELKILKGIHLFRSRRGRVPLGVALPVAQGILNDLGSLPEAEAVSFTGSLRRFREEVGDIDLLVASKEPEKVLDLLAKFPEVLEIKGRAANRAVGITRFGVEVDLWVVPPRDFPSALLWATGSRNHFRQLQDLAESQGVTFQEYKLMGKGDKRPLSFGTEEEIYRFLGLDVIPPELREAAGEVEAAAQGLLPRLVSLSDVQGELHCHTDWSDGVDSLEDMIAAARGMGYRYLAVTDHSRSLGIAGGLSLEELKRQIRRVGELESRLEGFNLLAGAEVDILPDGNLDFPDEVLSQLDVVIASVHSHFHQDQGTMTRRILTAISNPYVDILAHPSGRILGRRDPYQVDLEAVLRAAAERGTVLEINASPDRLDLPAIWARRCKELGIKIAVNTDAHEGGRLEEMVYGIGVARRGWLEAGDVINTWPWQQVKEYFHRKRSGQ